MTPREKAQLRQRERMAREAEELRRQRTGIPPGWRKVFLAAYTDGQQVIVTDEGDVGLGDDEDDHSCDAMGCGWAHVLARFNLPSPIPVEPRGVRDAAGGA